MPVTVNSRFLAVASTPQNINTGWQIRVLDYKDMTTLVAIVSEYTQFNFTQQLNDPGLGSITFDTDSPWWYTRLNNGDIAKNIQNREYVFEAWENGVRRFAWLGQTVEHTIDGPDENHVTTISGPGIAGVLRWACIMRPGWPKRPPIIGKDKNGDPVRRSVSFNDRVPAFLWQFPMRWASMQMWYTVFRAAQRRGLVRMVNPMFDNYHDSAKHKWQLVQTIENITNNHGYQPSELNENLLDFLNECTGQDAGKWFGQRLEWMMHPGFKLDVRPRIGTDRTRTVRFFSGQIESNQRTRDREEIFNRITAVDVEGGESIRTSASSVQKWNLREQRNETNKNVTNTSLRNALADRYLQQSRDEKIQWEIKIPYDEPGRVPFHHFYVGDSIMIDGVENRVMAISIALDAENSVPQVELTLQSILETRLQQVQKAITKLVNNPTQVNLEQLKNVDVSTKPDGEVQLVYNPKTGKWEPKPLGTGGTGTGGPQVFIRPTDPATDNTVTVRPGDFWLETYA